MLISLTLPSPFSTFPRNSGRTFLLAAARKARAQKGIPTRNLKSLTRSEDEGTPGEEAQDDGPPPLEPVPPKSPTPVPRKLGTATAVYPPHILTAPSAHAPPTTQRAQYYEESRKRKHSDDPQE